MPLIQPLAGLRPAPGRAEEVLAPPYDVLNTEEARVRAEGRPYSFLHVSKPEIDLPPGTDPYDPAVYARGAENLARMVSEGVLERDPAPYYYLYRLVMGGHTQTGLVAVASVAEYERNRIRRHEFTRPDKEDDRVRQIDALDAQTGPVFLTYRHDPEVDSLVRGLTATDPKVDVTTPDGVRHSLWVVSDADAIERLSGLFEAMDYLYIADGHHRSAAASRVARLRRKAGSAAPGEASYEYFLSVIFPDDQVQILDYNRVVRDLNGLDPETFLRRVAERFEVRASPAPVRPEHAGTFGMYLAGQWYRLTLDRARVETHDPVASLDVSLLAARLIEPVLGVGDPRRDPRIDFVGGIRGLAELERRVDSGEMAVAFALFPTSLRSLMEVADAETVMPPKSTWFEPKLADGMVSHVLD